MKKAYSVVLSLLLCMSLVAFDAGCTSAQAANVVNIVSTQLPLALNSAAAVANLAGNPVLGLFFKTAANGVTVDVPIIQAAIAAWKANKSAGNLAALASAVNAAASQVNQQVLAANKIANSQSDQIAMLSLMGLSAILNGMAASLSTVNGVKSAGLPAGFREVVAMTPRADIETVAKAYGVSPQQFLRLA